MHLVPPFYGSSRILLCCFSCC
uniref:Uncharacterized protein n=1 Tax=Vitis vinifera TaxID=29760 RepID=F6GTR6_VITVI